MSVTLLVSSLNKNPDELIGNNHITGNAVIVNQCDRENQREIKSDSSRIVIIETNTRGVGVNRNLCIENSFGDIVLFGDDDIVYDEDYAAKVENEFKAHPEADMIMFNVTVCDERKTYENAGFKKLSRFNIGRFPAYSIAVKRDVLLDKKLRFSPLFGGGAKYSNGEDSLFLRDAYKSGISMYATETHIGSEMPGKSTWFEGFTEKFFFDRGVLFAFLYGRTAWIWRMRFILTKKEMFKGNIGRKEADKLMKAGIKEGFELIKKGV
ncbi:MAG: glycosyltransferase family 2 protein [Lachnospiraceae bacterium]|nr:glycosyltransferase family 2 protein [Lachnospiraceae bacterium]